MGYTTDFEGKFEFSRPLFYREGRTLRQCTDVLEHPIPENHEGWLKSEGLELSNYCQWVIDDHGEGLQWDGNEKFYQYIDWLKYLIHFYFEEWGVVLSGEVLYQGEEVGDVGKIIVTDNKVTVQKLKYN